MNETFQDEDAPINIDITEEYERLADILFKDTNDMGLVENGSGKKRGPNGETETVMIVKDYLQGEFERKAKYVQRDIKDYRGDTKAEILDMQQKLAWAISLKARRGERNDVRQLYYSINSLRSKIKKIALDHDVVPELQQAIIALKEAPVETQQEEKAWLIKKQKEDPLKTEVENLKQDFIQRYLISKSGDGKLTGQHDFIISFNNKNRLIWDSLILLMAIWNCIETPLDISFEPPSSVVIVIINYAIDLFFYIDIIVAFRTSYLTFDGQEVKEWKQIAINYIFRGTFFLDLLSVLPFYEMIPGDQKALQILGVLKLIRIKRLPKLIANIDMKADTKAYLEVVQVIFFLSLFMHLLTCSWFFVTKLDSGLWIPPSETQIGSTSLYTSDSLSYQYITTLHTALMFFTGNDQLPITSLQIFFASLMILLSYLVNGSIFGYMAVLLRLMFKRGNAQQKYNQATAKVMRKVIGSRQMQDEVARYERQATSKREQQMELTEFMDIIGPSLKVKVTRKLVIDIFDKNYILGAMCINLEKTLKKQDGSDFASLVMKRLALRLCKPDDVLVQQGDLTNDIYFIADGEVSVSIADRVKQSFERFRVLEAGDHFGEISAIYGCPRSATCQANDFCTLAVLSKQNYDRIAGEIPEFSGEMKKYVLNAYNDDEVKNWAFETLKQLPFLKRIESEKESSLLHKIYFSMKRKILFAGELYMNPGKPIHHLTIIQDGILELFTTFGGKQFSLEQLMRGSILNYRSFFTDDQAQIYARCTTSQVTLLELNYSTLTSLTTDSASFEKSFISHQMLVLNTSFSKHFYPLDYIRVWHHDYMTAKQAELPSDVSQRASAMKLMVMRRVAEVRWQRGKLGLREVLVPNRDEGKSRMEVRQKLLDLYGQFEEDVYGWAGDLGVYDSKVAQKITRYHVKPYLQEEEDKRARELRIQAERAQEDKVKLKSEVLQEEGGPAPEEEEGDHKDNPESRNKHYEILKERLMKSLRQLDEESDLIEKIRERLDQEIEKEYPKASVQ